MAKNDDYKFNPFLPVTRKGINANHTCSACIHFDGSRHASDPRTAHAGICKRFSETSNKNDTCNQWLSSANLPNWGSVVQAATQTTLDL